MISEYVFRPQVIEEGEETGHIEDLTQLVATPVTGDSIDSIHGFTEEIVEKIEDDELSWVSPAFEGYCRQFGRGLFTNEAVLEYIRCDSLEEEYDVGDLPVVNLKFVAYVALVEFELEHEQYSELIEYDNEFGAEFCDFPIYNYYKSRIYTYEEWPKHGQIAINYGHESVSNIESNPNVLAHYADLLLSIHKSDANFEVPDTITTGGSTLETAKSYIQRSITQEPDIPEYSYTLSRILLEQGEFEAAESAINEAINKGRAIHNYNISWLIRYRSTIELEEQRENLEGFSQDIDSIKNQVSDIEEELNQTVDKYRTQVLQFIAFFAALITVATASIQIVQKTATFGEAGKLILVFTGGLLIAFGGFGVLLPRDLDRSYLSRVAIILATGVGLIVIGWCLPV